MVFAGTDVLCSPAHRRVEVTRHTARNQSPSPITVRCRKVFLLLLCVVESFDYYRGLLPSSRSHRMRILPWQSVWHLQDASTT